jgi:16S rRNA (uracil1498-N3)-methyltransferase
MQRYFIDKIPSDLHILLQDNDFHHIKHVMRFSIGDLIVVCDDKVCYECQIESFDSSSCSVIGQLKLESIEKNFQIDIAQGLIRRERFEYMIQKATELGVDTIIPMQSQFSIVKIDDKKRKNKVDRWQKIAKEASEQSHRSNLAKVSDIQSLETLPFDQYDCILVAYEKENQSTNLKQVLQDKYQRILAIIGPEGGLSYKEIEFLSKQTNVHLVGLGQRILRSETASSYLLSVIHYEYEMII